MKQLMSVLFVLVLVSTAQAYGSEQPALEPVAKDAVETVESQQTPEQSEIEVTEECNTAEAFGEGSKVLKGGFGSHCSTPFTCSHQESGLGFGCTCTYSCDCAYCNGQLTKINCVLVDDGGCFACPLPNGW